MNFPTIIISIFLIGLFALVIRHIIKNGTCECGEKNSCHSCGLPCCTHCSHGQLEKAERAKH